MNCGVGYVIFEPVSLKKLVGYLLRYRERLTRFHCSLLPAVSCGDPPEVNEELCVSTASQVQRGLNIEGYEYQTEVEYSCVGGRKFPDGLRTKTVVCTRYGQWSMSSIYCQCK
jgi:Sushi repeat (SCR repeat)